MKNLARLISLLLLVLTLAAVLLPLPALAQTEKTELTMNLIGDYYNGISAGKDNRFFLELRNDGTRDLTNIRLSADAPSGWVVEYNPSVVAQIPAGSLQTVDINIRPAAEVEKRDYMINLIAEANELRKVQSIWVNVRSATYWPWIGAGVAAIVIAAFIFIFLRFGRS